MLALHCEQLYTKWPFDQNAGDDSAIRMAAFGSGEINKFDVDYSDNNYQVYA